MSRDHESVSRRWSTMETTTSRTNGSSSTEESSSSAIDSAEYSPRAKNTSTPLRSSRWSDLERINRSLSQTRQARGKIKEIEEVEEASSEGKRSTKGSQRHKGRISREKRQDGRRRVVERQKGRRNRRGKRKHDRRFEVSDEDGKEKERSSSESSDECYGEGDSERSKKQQRELRGKNELPITEILKRSQENARTKYEQPPALPMLTTDKIYVQHGDGFSAMKIKQLRDRRGGETGETEGSIAVAENKNYPPIRVAILVQKFWKNIGLVYQGLLAGMALMHFIMLQVFFNVSIEFVERYSMISEIYASIFSFLVALCIVSIFDKFDLARLDMDHLREIYLDYNKAVIAVPLYLIVFCLHQVCLKTDNRLNLIYYYGSNDSLWENVTNVQTLLDDLNNWQKVSMSKDLLAVIAWLFVSLGTKDDAFLIYLQSMEKYANNVESSGQ